MFTLSRARLDDAAAMVALDAALAAEGVAVPFAPDEVRTVEQQQRRLETFVDDPEQLELLAVADGDVIGEIGLGRWSRLRAAAHVRVLWIGVASEWRRRGLGLALTAQALDWAHTQGTVRRIELSVFTDNAPAIALYKRFGFEIEGTRRGLLKRDSRWIDDHVMALTI